MEENRTIQISGYCSELSKQLCAIGNRLQNSQLLSELKILEKLIYKFKNQHRQEKYFKGLEKMKKSLKRWTMLSLDNKLIATSKSICGTDDEVKSTSHLKDLLTELMHGGKLAIRNIVLCQETVQYTLGYFSMGFFVTLHVTLISLVSRIWVLLKDCWFHLVECYQLVRLLIQSKTEQTTLSDFPECLTSWLCDDLNHVYTVSRNMGTNNSYSGLDSSEVLKKIFGKATSFQVLYAYHFDILHSKPALADNGIFTSSAKAGWLACENLDLGEPVEEELSQIESFGNFNATPMSSKHRVSGLKKSLALRFDLEHVDSENLETKADRTVLKNGRTLTKFGDSGTSLRLSDKTLLYKVRHLRHSDKRLVLTNRPKSTLHKVGEHIFIKKQPGRVSLRNLTAVNTCRGFSSRKIRVLLKILRYVLRFELPSADHKILLRAQRLLRREMKRREKPKNQPGSAGAVPLKSERQSHRKSEIVSKKRGSTRNSRESNWRKISFKSENSARNWRLKGWYLKGQWHLKGWRIRGALRGRRNEHRFFNRTKKSPRNNRVTRFKDDNVSSNERKGKDMEQIGSKRDEIDLIFGSLGL